MSTTILLLVAIGSFLFSSGNTSYGKANKQTKTFTLETAQQNQATQTIELNKGKKWEVDTNMLTHIRNMENDVNSMIEDRTADYNLLAQKLKTGIDLLTSNCTMKGKAHDELHKWLLPYIDLVKELSEAKNEIKAAKQFENIKASFATFNQYFK